MNRQERAEANANVLNSAAALLQDRGAPLVTDPTVRKSLIAWLDAESERVDQPDIESDRGFAAALEFGHEVLLRLHAADR
jgi:hypothetical protein